MTNANFDQIQYWFRNIPFEGGVDALRQRLPQADSPFSQESNAFWYHECGFGWHFEASSLLSDGITLVVRFEGFNGYFQDLSIAVYRRHYPVLIDNEEDFHRGIDLAFDKAKLSHLSTRAKIAVDAVLATLSESFNPVSLAA